MTQGVKDKNINLRGQHLGTMVNKKRERALFVALFGFCFVTIYYLHFFAQTGGLTYQAKLIDITLNKLEKLITTISHNTCRP